MKLNTKEKRLQARNFYRSEGDTEINLPEYELQAFIKDEENHYTLTLFLGTAGKPTIYCYYRTQERRDMALHKAIEEQIKRMEYKAQRKQENKGNLTGSAATAKAIKARLTKEFPGIKFSVTSDNYSMGNSVDISWTDGPIYDQVNDITRQYQYGHFDGMTDSYEYRDINSSLGCPGAKYVHCNRKLSPEYKAQLQEVLERDFTPYHGEKHYAPFQYVEAEKAMLGITQEPEPSEVKQEAREPWQMRKDEYLKAETVTFDGKIRHIRDKISPCGMPTKAFEITGSKWYSRDEGDHKWLIKQALKEGKPVPAEVLRDYDLIEPSAEVETSQSSVGAKVLDITARIKQRQEQEDAQKCLETFKAQYLPFLSSSDIAQMVSAPEERRGDVISQICMRIDLERGAR